MKLASKEVSSPMRIGGGVGGAAGAIPTMALAKSAAGEAHDRGGLTPSATTGIIGVLQGSVAQEGRRAGAELPAASSDVT